MSKCPRLDFHSALVQISLSSENYCGCKPQEMPPPRFELGSPPYSNERLHLDARSMLSSRLNHLSLFLFLRGWNPWPLDYRGSMKLTIDFPLKEFCIKEN